MRERVDATRDKPHRQATATRSARQPDPDAVLSSERVERGAHIIIGREKKRSGDCDSARKMPIKGTDGHSPKTEGTKPN